MVLRRENQVKTIKNYNISMTGSKNNGKVFNLFSKRKACFIKKQLSLKGTKNDKNG
jgi:hypothetical protein